VKTQAKRTVALLPRACCCFAADALSFSLAIRLITACGTRFVVCFDLFVLFVLFDLFDLFV
jgi:hypothetical protein